MQSAAGRGVRQQSSNNRERRQRIDSPEAAQMPHRFGVSCLGRKGLNLFIERAESTAELF